MIAMMSGLELRMNISSHLPSIYTGTTEVFVTNRRWNQLQVYRLKLVRLYYTLFDYILCLV